jgi:hypothetical protein
MPVVTAICADPEHAGAAVAALLRLEIRDRTTTRRAIRILREQGAQRIRVGELA